MKTSLIAEKYIDLAHQLAPAEPIEAVRCVLRALDIHPTHRIGDARQLLSQALAADCVEVDGSAVDVSRLRARQAKLDQMCQQHALIAPSTINIPSCESSSNPSFSADLQRRLARFDQWLQSQSGTPFDEAREFIQPLVQKVCPQAGSALDIPADSGVVDDDDWLSVEHQIHNLGNDLYRLDYYRESIACYEVVVHLRPDLLETWFNKSLAHTRCENYEAALADLDKVIELDPGLAEAHYTHGLVNEYRQEYLEALSDYDKALEIDPKYTKAQTQRQAVLEKLASRQPKTSKREEEDSDGEIQDFGRFMVKPDNKLSDVGGHRSVKRQLKKIVAYLRGDAALEEWGAEPPRGVLLYGPPGVGKTHLARCLAGEASVPFYCPPTSIFASKWHGTTERNFRRLFEQAGRHKASIIFIDELDSVAPIRVDAQASDGWYNRIVGSLLELFDNLEQRDSGIVIVAATNRRKNIDRAFLRPGRFNYLLPVRRPSAVELAEIWIILLAEAEARAKRLDFLSPELERAVGADKAVCSDHILQTGTRHDAAILQLARLSADRSLTGAEVREIIRRVIDDKVMAQLECRWDLGPITQEDLIGGLEGYNA